MLNRLRLMQKEDGFTLIELLIVVLIIGILAAVAIPVYLGVQNQAHKSAIQSDTNITVKKVQVGLTEGVAITSLYGTTPGSDKNSSIIVKKSTTAGASANDFMVIGTEDAKGTPAGAVSYTYTYDSVTGSFTAANSALDAPTGTLVASTDFSTPGSTVMTIDPASGYTSSVDVKISSDSGNASYGITGAAGRGGAAGRVNLSSSTPNYMHESIGIEAYALTPGATYRLDFYTANITSDWGVTKAFNNVNTSNVSATVGSTDANGWTKVSTTFTATNAYVLIVPQPVVEQEGISYQIDDMALYKI